jgi:outer membrane protein assembly factor BamB
MLGPTIDGTTLYLPVNDITLLAVDIRTEIPKLSGHGNHCQASIAIEDGVVYYNTGKSCLLYAQEDLTTRFHHIRVEGGGLAFFPQSGPAVHGGHSYFAKGDHNLYAIRYDGDKAKTLWSRPTPALVRSSIAIAGNHLYFGCDDGHVYAVECATGNEAWRYKTDGPVVSSPWVAEGVLYVGSDDGNVYALE